MSFSIVQNDGSCHVADPRREAYTYSAWLVGCGRVYTLIVEAGTFTVKSPGLQTLVFKPLL